MTCKVCAREPHTHTPRATASVSHRFLIGKCPNLARTQATLPLDRELATDERSAGARRGSQRSDRVSARRGSPDPAAPPTEGLHESDHCARQGGEAPLKSPSLGCAWVALRPPHTPHKLSPAPVPVGISQL